MWLRRRGGDKGQLDCGNSKRRGNAKEEGGAHWEKMNLVDDEAGAARVGVYDPEAAHPPGPEVDSWVLGEMGAVP